MNSSFRDACTENKIIPVSDPLIEDVKGEEGEDLSFKATVEIDPEINITDYKKGDIKIGCLSL